MIDKSARQHYRNIGFSKVKPSKNGLRPGYAFAGTGGNTGSSGGTGGGGAAQRARAISLKVDNTSTGQHWKLGTFRLDIQADGRR